MELITGLLVGGDRQADRRGSVRIGGGADLAAIALAQQTPDQGQRTRATNDVEGGHCPPLPALHGVLQRLEGTLHERTTALIEDAGADDDRLRILSPPGQINCQPARVGMEPLFLLATLLQQPCQLGRRPGLDTGLAQRQVQEEGIHIIPAELGDPGAADHLVAPGCHTDDGRIEGAPTEIIHNHQFAAGAGTRTASMMGIFDARRGRFIEQPADVKAGAAEGLQR